MRIENHDRGQAERHTTPSIEHLQPFVLALRQTMGDRLIALVLYGSRARGDAQPDSDWDVLLIAEELPAPAFSRYRYVKSLLPPEWRGRLAVLAKTPVEFESYLPALFLDIALDGIILWDADDYIAGRLAGLRRLLSKHGLYRERRNGNFVWRWQEFPGYNWRLAWEDAK